MTPQNAFISIDQICNSWLLKRGKSIHSYYKIMVLAAEAIQELALTSLPLVSHKIIKKQSNESWFTLPQDYTEWVSAGIRVGEFWRPVSISNRLMPMPNEIANSEYNGEYNMGNSWTSWLNPAIGNVSPTNPTTPYFNTQYFNPAYFNAGVQPIVVSGGTSYYNPLLS